MLWIHRDHWNARPFLFPPLFTIFRAAWFFFRAAKPIYRCLQARTIFGMGMDFKDVAYLLDEVGGSAGYFMRLRWGAANDADRHTGERRKYIAPV